MRLVMLLLIAHSALAHDAFDLLVQAPKAAKSGGAVSLDVRVRPKGEHKINLEAPVKLELDAGSNFTTPQIKRDAKLLHASTQVSLKKSGAQKLKGRLQFYLCLPQSCIKHDAAFEHSVVVD